VADHTTSIATLGTDIDTNTTNITQAFTEIDAVAADVTTLQSITGQHFVLPTTEPANPVVGSVYYDGSGTRVYNGNKYVSI